MTGREFPCMIQEKVAFDTEKKIFIVIYGVSCAGKSPTINALKSQGIDFYEPPVIKSWECRPDCKPRKEDEKVWNNPQNFLPKNSDIEALEDNPQYITTKFRGHSQAFNLENVLNSPKKTILRDLYYTFIPKLKQSKYFYDKVEIRTIFFSPFTKEEIKEGLGKDSFKKHVYSKMLKILENRSFKQKGDEAYSKGVMQDNRVRAITAYDEIEASRYADHIVYNPFPEGDDAWDNFDINRKIDSEGESLKDVLNQLEKIICRD